MAPDPKHGGALAPVEGALSKYMEGMSELQADHMPELVLHEYTPFYDSSDLGPADWARLAADIKVNYLHFDGFVILTGTDTMAYAASALSFMLENLGKPVVFTGSQIPLCEPYVSSFAVPICAHLFILSFYFARRTISFTPPSLLSLQLQRCEEKPHHGADFRFARHHQRGDDLLPRSASEGVPGNESQYTSADGIR